MERLTSSAILEASVVSTEIGSSWGSADEGLVDVELNAWNNSSTPRTDWNAMVDNYEERGSEVDYHFEENTPTSIKDKMEGKTHIFCRCVSIGYFHRNRLLLRIH